MDKEFILTLRDVLSQKRLIYTKDLLPINNMPQKSACLLLAGHNVKMICRNIGDNGNELVRLAVDITIASILKPGDIVLYASKQYVLKYISFYNQEVNHDDILRYIDFYKE